MGGNHKNVPSTNRTNREPLSFGAVAHQIPVFLVTNRPRTVSGQFTLWWWATLWGGRAGRLRFVRDANVLAQTVFVLELFVTVVAAARCLLGVLRSYVPP